jgi:hypothetical protein
MATYQSPPAGAAGDPTRTLGVVGLVLAACGVLCAPLALAGLVVSIIAFIRARNAGYQNKLALAGIIVAIVLLVAGTIINLTVWPMIFNTPR